MAALAKTERLASAQRSDIVLTGASEAVRARLERGGVLGMMALALVVDPDRPTLERYLDHFDHAVSVMGVDHVGLGADFIDQVAQAELAGGKSFEGMMADAQQAGAGRFGLEGFTGPEHYPLLVVALRARGYDGERLNAILGGNFRRLLAASLPE